MDAKNIEAMARGREYMLAKFANLPLPGTIRSKFVEGPCEDNMASADASVDAFRSQFGDLCPGVAKDEWYGLILSFRYQWHWRVRRTGDRSLRRNLSSSIQMRGAIKKHFEMDDESAWGTNLLNRSNLPIAVDFFSGQITVTPETLLDWLVLSLIACRRNLAICASIRCKAPYFVKIHPRTRYCSLECFASGRLRGQREWEKAKRKKTRARKP
jgi:hypothetical protein